MARRLAIFALVACVSSSVTATTVIPPTFDELVSRATEIFVGTVVSRESKWVQGPGGETIVTLITFAIEENLKGDVQGQTTLRFRGGTVGEVSLRVEEMPEFRVGDRDVIFVGNRNAVSPLVGFMHGRFRLEHDPASGLDIARSHDGRSLAASTPGFADAGNRARGPDRDTTLFDVRSEIQRRLRSR